MYKKILVLGIVTMLTQGCASSPSYPEKLSMRAAPVSSQQTDAECSWIRSEIAKMQTLSAIQGSGNMMVQAAANRNIAALQSRAATVGCRAAFSSQSNQGALNASPIDQCIHACLTNTGRTKTQCFDSCNK